MNTNENTTKGDRSPQFGGLSGCAPRFLTSYDVGLLEIGMRVSASGQHGTVRRVHEPSWVDHKTRAFKQKLASADVQLDTTRPYENGTVASRSFPCEVIFILPNSQGHESPSKRKRKP